jgi:hypothetical protein
VAADEEKSTYVADAPAPRPAPAEPAKGKRERSFVLAPDKRGATINGALYVLYAAVSIYIATLVAPPKSVWFYVFYFMFFLAVFQGYTVVVRQCLLMSAKSLARVEVAGRKVRITRRSGEEVELTQDLDYTRRKGLLVLQGKTHDNQKVNEVIRKGSLGDDGFEALLEALKRIR